MIKQGQFSIELLKPNGQRGQLARVDNNNFFLLPDGCNYHLRFSTVVPGTINISIDGKDHGSVPITRQMTLDRPPKGEKRFEFRSELAQISRSFSEYKGNVFRITFTSGSGDKSTVNFALILDPDESCPSSSESAYAGAYY